MESEQRAIHPDPTPAESFDWVRSTTRHSVRMEFCLGEMQIGSKDPQRPHDTEGPGSKFDLRVLRGLALESRPGISRDLIVVPALMIHRGQHHHLKWNDENSGATDDEMMVGAMDAICSLLENRLYQGGRHTFEEIERIIQEKNPPYRRYWMTQALNQAKRIRLPDTEQIQSLDRIPNLGLPKATHEAIVTRVRETLVMLEHEYGYRLLNHHPEELWNPHANLNSYKTFS